MYISTKAALSLADAMDQPNFNLRRPMRIILVGDQERRSINFITVDTENQNFTAPLFDNTCNKTDVERAVETTVRSAVLTGDAGADLTLWVVDGPMAGKWTLRIQCSGGTSSLVTITTPLGQTFTFNFIANLCTNPINVSDITQIISDDRDDIAIPESSITSNTVDGVKTVTFIVS
jgi:hypothetical protein